MITPGAPTIAKYGSYVGDGINNKAVAHGLGRIPAFVRIRTSGVGMDSNAEYLIAGLAQVNAIAAVAAAVTAADATNFYVGTDAAHANANGTTYYWMAV